MYHFSKFIYEDRNNRVTIELWQVCDQVRWLYAPISLRESLRVAINRLLPDCQTSLPDRWGRSSYIIVHRL